MDSARPESPPLLTLQQTALMLGVSVDALLTWNEHNILKPTITPEGRVGYEQKQIEQFVAILRMLQPQQEAPITKPLPLTQHISTTNSLDKAFIREKVTAKIHLASKMQGHKLFFPYVLSSIAVLLIVISAFTAIQQETHTLSQTAQTDTKVLGAQTNQAQPTGTLAFTMPTQPKENVVSSKNLDPLEENALGGKFAAIFTGKHLRNSANLTAADITTSGVKTLLQEQQTGDFNVSDLAFNNLSSFANTTFATNENNAKENALDANGNITGDTPKTTVLAVAEGSSVEGRSVEQSSIDLTSQLVVLAIGAGILMLFALKKPRKAVVAVSQTGAAEKILEVEQKMDGTVVVTFLGKMYKISKPELHSDSDQFIQRLMALSQPGVKEMEYDSFKDSQIRITTPLSRLVTRLGFVGIKRDLFFPRTSKNSVLFRKYITRDDLSSMNVTTEQILQDITQTV